MFIYPDCGLDTQSLLIAIMPKAFATWTERHRNSVLSHMHLEDAFSERRARPMNNSDTNFKIEEGQWSCFRDYSSSLHTKFRVEHFRESQSLTWRGPWSFLEAAPAADIRQCRIVF